MIFDDIFYPDNPKRRKEVADLQASIRKSYNDYKSAWNELVQILNPALASCRVEKWKNVRLDLLKCEIEKNTLGDCAKEINDTLSKSKTTLTDLIKDIGLDGQLPKDWETSGAKLDDVDYNQWIARGVFAGVSTVLAGFITYYALQGITISISLLTIAAGITASLGAFIGGAMLSAVIGAATFVISDMIFSAITGAIERKKLQDAISALKETKKNFADPLDSAFRSLAGILTNVKNGSYPLDDTHYLIKNKKGDYVIVEVVVPESRSAHRLKSENTAQAVQDKIEELLEAGKYITLISASEAA